MIKLTIITIHAGLSKRRRYVQVNENERQTDRQRQQHLQKRTNRIQRLKEAENWRQRNRELERGLKRDGRRQQQKSRQKRCQCKTVFFERHYRSKTSPSKLHYRPKTSTSHVNQNPALWPVQSSQFQTTFFFKHLTLRIIEFTRSQLSSFKLTNFMTQEKLLRNFFSIIFQVLFLVSSNVVISVSKRQFLSSLEIMQVGHYRISCCVFK